MTKDADKGSGRGGLGRGDSYANVRVVGSKPRSNILFSFFFLLLSLPIIRFTLPRKKQAPFIVADRI